MQEGAYKAWLGTLPIVDGTVENQMSRIRRLEKAFGDIDLAYDTDQMAAMLNALEYSAQDAASKKPLAPGIVSRGSPAGAMRTLRHAAKKYCTFRFQQNTAIASIDLSDGFHPNLAPKTAPARKLKPTGFWIFQANPSRWKADEWARSGEDSLLYFVSKDDRDLVQVGDLGVIRRTSYRGKPSALLALAEVVEATLLRSEPDPKFFVDQALGAKPDFRIRLERISDFDEPLLVSNLPDEPAFALLRKGLQRTTTPVPAAAFAYLADRARLDPEDLAARRGSRSKAGYTALQQAANAAPPATRTIVSRRIERGPVGDKVKAARGYRCQVCQALGRDPIAFRKANGEPYAEAHHVIFVSTMRAGVLDATNVMVLCPNHHRQAHYGLFEIVSADSMAWTINIDGKQLVISQTQIW